MLRWQVEKHVLRHVELRIHAQTWLARNLERLPWELRVQQLGFHVLKHGWILWRGELLLRVELGVELALEQQVEHEEECELWLWCSACASMEHRWLEA